VRHRGVGLQAEHRDWTGGGVYLGRDARSTNRSPCAAPLRRPRAPTQTALAATPAAGVPTTARVAAGAGRSSRARRPKRGTQAWFRSDDRGEIFDELLDDRSALPCAPLGASNSPNIAETFPCAAPRSPYVPSVTPPQQARRSSATSRRARPADRLTRAWQRGPVAPQGRSSAYSASLSRARRHSVSSDEYRRSRQGNKHRSRPIWRTCRPPARSQA
jgi:hypothetical protein